MLIFLFGLYFYYSVRNDFTGLAIAALTDWKLMVINAIMMADIPAAKKIHQLISIRYL